MAVTTYDSYDVLFSFLFKTPFMSEKVLKVILQSSSPTNRHVPTRRSSSLLSWTSSPVRRPPNANFGIVVRCSSLYSGLCLVKRGNANPGDPVLVLVNPVECGNANPGGPVLDVVTSHVVLNPILLDVVP